MKSFREIILGAADAVMDLLFLPVVLLRLVGRGVRFVLRLVRRGIVSILRSPIGAYNKLMKGRDWLMAKVEYLQAESAKWKALFQTVKAPYSFLRACGLNPQMAMSLLIGAGAVTGTAAAQATIFAEPSFARGDTGIYTAPSDVPTFFSEEYNTLRVDLGTTPVKSLTIEDVSVNSFTGSALPSGATTAVDVGGTAASSTWLIVGKFEFAFNRCTTLTLQDVTAHTLNVIDNASDGLSFASSPGSARKRNVIGGHGMASAMSTSAGMYDRIHIQAPASGTDGQVQDLTLRNIYAKGPCLLHRIKAGTITLEGNIIGGDSDLATKAFTIATTVAANVTTINGNVEVAMPVPATQTIDGN